jgi:hypothetical protein
MIKFSRSTLGMVGAFLLIVLAGACAGANVQPSPTPPPARAVTVIATLPPRTIVRTPTPIRPTATPLPPSQTPYTPDPTITSSGPTLVSSTQQAKRINDNMPAEVGPFKKKEVQGGTYASQFGGVMYYVTSEGAVYQIKYWLTGSAGDAAQRYVGLVRNARGAQPLNGLGDEAVIVPAPNPLYIAVRWRNISLELYRPDPRGTTPKPITDDEAIALIRSVYSTLQQ